MNVYRFNKNAFTPCGYLLSVWQAQIKIPVIFLILVFTSLSAYPQFYQIRNFTAEDGLPSPETYNVFQDSKGYIWIATDMGVSRYNGIEFKNFSTENGLPDNSIFGMCEDSKRRIWFISFSGKLSYFLNDSIYTLPCNHFLEKEIAKLSTITISIYVDPADTVWLGTFSNRVLKIAPSWQTKDVSWISIPTAGEYLYLIDEKNLVFGGNRLEKNKVTLYSKQGERICQVDPKIFIPLYTKPKYYGAILNDGTFLASVDNVLIRFTKDGVILTRSIQKEPITTLREDKDKIISTSYGGLRIHNVKDLNDYEVIPDFSDKVCTSTLIDREGSLWITTEGHGLYCIPFRSGRYYTAEHGLSKSKISCIAEKKGKILAGHLNGTVSILEGNEIKTIRLQSGSNKFYSGKRIACIFISSKSEVYIGNQLNVFKLKNNYKNYETYTGICAKKIAKEGDKFMLVLHEKSVLWFEPGQRFDQMKKINVHLYLDNIYQDRKGVIWICALNGLWCYQGDSLHYLGDKNPLLSARITDIVEDQAGRLWMSSRGNGVIVKAGEAFYTVKQINGLASNMCRNLFIDSNQVVWVGSNSGLSKITLKKERAFSCEVNVYTKKDGLLSNEVNYIVGMGKDLILAHNNGISILKPGQLRRNLIAPPVYITDADINGRIYRKDSLRLDYSENYFKVNYIGLSFKNPGTVEYKYKMEGLDTSWVYTNYTSAQFQTLNPGNYRFIVYAKNGPGNWSSRPAILQISILPVWWQMWVFKLLMGLLLAMALYLLIKVRWNKEKKRTYEKAALKHKITTSELKALRAQMNPHFIFNAINSIQHFITSNNPTSSQKFLAKFAKLIRYVVDNSKPASIPLGKEIEAITLFLDLEKMRFENRFDYRITVGAHIDVTFIQIPSMLIQPYIENCIWHGIMHKEGNGKIEISFELQAHILKCTVEDNGIGRKKSQEYKRGQNVAANKSVGMSITQERLEIINQLNKSPLSIQVTDLTDEDGNALGTRVELFIPVF